MWPRDTVKCQISKLCVPKQQLFNRPGRWVGACSTHWGDEKCIQNLVINSQGKKPLVRLGNKCDDNIKIDFK